MHAVTSIRDNYGSNPKSCVWGSLRSLGTFDIAYIKRVYGKKRHR